MAREDGSPQDPRFFAAIRLLERTGMQTFGIRYQDDEKPVVWVAVATWDKKRTPDLEGAEAAGAMTPLEAVMRLCEVVIDGGQCTHCKRAAAVESDWIGNMPLENAVCWYRYDPELQEFRRGCEGD
jgi:hypothetical protein